MNDKVLEILDLVQKYKDHHDNLLDPFEESWLESIVALFRHMSQTKPQGDEAPIHMFGAVQPPDTDLVRPYTVDEITRDDSPGPLNDVLKKLAFGVNHLLHEKNYDDVGYELLSEAVKQAEEIISIMNREPSQGSQNDKKETPKERKLFETENFLITIVKRLTGDMPLGPEMELYFISEDVKDALKNIGTKDARYFAKVIEDAKLHDKFKKNRHHFKRDCGCRKCLKANNVKDEIGFPITFSRMILCPICGNKRCPHATDHNYSCTNSNEPGQEGSAYQ